MDVVDRPIEEKNKGAIEQRLKDMGEYVQMSYLQRALKSGLDFDTKKFVMIRLAEIFEAKRMYLEAAKLMKIAADINTTFRNKIRDFMKSVELHIKGGDYNNADNVFMQALALGNDMQKTEMRKSLKDYYLTQAKILLGEDKRSQAVKVYEKLLSLDLSNSERQEVKTKLLDLYDKLGEVRSYYKLKDSKN